MEFFSEFSIIWMCDMAVSFVWKEEAHHVAEEPKQKLVYAHIMTNQQQIVP